MALMDIDAQCLIEDREGNIFICPLYQRAEGERFFKSFDEHVENERIPPTFPEYLLPISNLHNLVFYRGSAHV